jgi:hypothetical protein
VYSLLDQCGIPVDKEPLRQTLAAIQLEADPGAVSRTLCALLEREVKARSGPPESLAERTAASLAGVLGRAYRGHLGRYLAAVNWRQPPGPAVEAAVGSLDQDLLRRVLPLVRAAARGRAEPGPARPAGQSAAQATIQPVAQALVQPVAAPAGHPLLDAFGRGLLSPVENRYPILDQDGHRRSVPGFPRIFCAPVLAEIKFRLIGDDKYDATNAKFIESIRKHCQVEGQLDRSKLREYFQYPAVRQYLTAYCIHLLKHLLDEDRRDIFQANVNVRLRKNVTDTAREFTDMYMSILTSSWALSVFDNLEGKHRTGAVPRILRYYIPGKMADFGD